jgi:hypothetical protein
MLWQVLKPIGNAPPKINFDKDEAALIFSTSDPHLMLDGLQLADQHNDLILLAKRYAKERPALEFIAEGAWLPEGREMAQFRTRVARVEGLAEALVERARPVQEAAELTHRLLRKYFIEHLGTETEVPRYQQKPAPPLPVAAQQADASGSSGRA